MFVFLLPIVFRHFAIPLLKKKTRLALGLAISRGVLLTVVNEKKEKPLPAPYRTTPLLPP